LAVKVALDVSAVPAKVAGAGRYIVQIARRLPARGVETTLVTRRNDVERWREFSPAAAVAPLVPGGRVARLATEAAVLGRSSTARASDVWHGPHYTMPHGGATPTVVTVHDLTFFTNPEWHERSKVAFFRRAIRYSAEHARVLVSVSAFSARLMEEILPAHAPIVVAPLGVELNRFQTSSPEDPETLRSGGLPAGSLYILFVGTVEPRKGLDVLLAAFAEVARDHDSVELWLAGQIGWGEGPIESVLAGHAAKERIRRLGYVDDELLAALYRGAAVVAYPSRGEGFGLPVLEAMACGAQVVTTRGTAMEEVAGDAARLVPVGDPRALAAALDEALRASDEERTEGSIRARTRAEHFTWDACVDQHLVAYDMAREH
jgi:glycosyltransferase involved in cell wall biosynthesis